MGLGVRVRVRVGYMGVYGGIWGYMGGGKVRARCAEKRERHGESDGRSIEIIYNNI